MSPARIYRLARVVSAVVLAATAVWHVVLVVRHEGDAARHGLFVVVNLALAALLVLRHRWAFYPTLALTAQQLASHGLDLSRSFTGDGGLDWASLAVCLFFPTLATVLFMERSEEAEAAER